MVDLRGAAEARSSAFDATERLTAAIGAGALILLPITIIEAAIVGPLTWTGGRSRSGWYWPSYRASPPMAPAARFPGKD